MSSRSLRASGDVWTLPIVLQGRGQEFAAFQPGQSVRLVDRRTGAATAILHLEDKYEINPRQIAERWFGTSDAAHPGVRRLLNRGLTFLGGPIESLANAPSTRSPYELSPAQTRMLFDMKGWSKIVAFHARNVPHRGHEHLIANACERSNADGVLIQPLVGPKQSGDFSDGVVLAAYERLIRLAFPNALLASLSGYHRFSGPREAVFSALCSRNFGCTHFVLGRDPASNGDLDSARQLFEQLGDIGITPVYFDAVYFSDDERTTVEQNGDRNGLREISGSRIRELLASRQGVPAWCMRDELSGWLASEQSGGAKLFELPGQVH